MKIENIPKIRTICCGDYHSILIDVEGNCFSCGSNCFGQLGSGNMLYKKVPIKIENLPPICSASAGTYHTILIAENGTAYGFGHNDRRQLGSISPELNVLIPREIKIQSGVIAAYCSGNSTILQDVNNNFWRCGKNEYGKLGLGHNNIAALSDIDSIICLKNSIVFIGTNGKCKASGMINGKMVSIKINHRSWKVGALTFNYN